jgi:hypothetical protein
VLPYYGNKRTDISYDEAGVRRLFELSDLHSVAAQLKNDPKISFFSNENDFLLRSEDIAWLKGLFGERAYFFERGGHLDISPTKMCGKLFQGRYSRTSFDSDAHVCGTLLFLIHYEVARLRRNVYYRETASCDCSQGFAKTVPL